MLKELILIGWYSFLGIFNIKYTIISDCYERKLLKKKPKITGFETNGSNLDILFGHKHDLEKERLK